MFNVLLFIGLIVTFLVTFFGLTLIYGVSKEERVQKICVKVMSMNIAVWIVLGAIYLESLI